MVKLDFHGKEERRWTGPRLRSGAMIGHTTETTAKIWVRSRYEGTYHLILCKDELIGGELKIGKKKAGKYVSELGDKVVYTNSYDFKNGTDRIHVFDIDNLSEGTRYHYYVFSANTSVEDRMIIGRQTPHSFKTISKDKTSLTFGLYSCHDPYKKNSGTLPWKHFFSVLKEMDADFVVGGGDQVYVDTTETDLWKWLKKNKGDLLHETGSDETKLKKIMLSWYQDVYRGYWGFPDVRRVHRSFPNYMIWDDHEIMDGWGSRTRDELSDELDTWYEWEDEEKNLLLADTMFKAAKDVYYQYQHRHNPNTADGVFDFPLTQKHSQFYFMDMRGQREFDLKRLKKRDGKKATDRILGKKQLARLKDWLQNISGETKMVYIVSPVPVVHWTGFAVNTGDVFGAKDDFRDEWDHETNHAERDKVLAAVFAQSDKFGVPIAFLSGDVHMSAVFRLTNRKYRDAKVFQITSSPITRPPAPGIADLILSDKGTLKTGKKYSAYRYQRLAKFHARNFCILKSETSNEGGLNLYVDFYGESEDQDEMRRKRIQLVKC